MLKAVRSRLTYANVVATGALFVALGGGAYALSGVPDATGVFHGCVSKKSGGLRVVTSARSCHGVKKRHRRIVDPGEFAVAWNQQGRQGGQGPQGNQGPQGAVGPQGPGARSFATTLDQGTTRGTLVTLNNGLTLTGTCGGSTTALGIQPTTDITNNVQGSGTDNVGTTVAQFDVDSGGEKFVSANTTADFDVIARNSTVDSRFSRIDAHARFGAPCTFWGIITPSG
jgi:hypothetical protein